MLALRWDVVLFCRDMEKPPRGLRAASRTDVALPEGAWLIGMGAGVDPAVAAWLKLRALVLELVRWCRLSALVEGTGNPGPDKRCVSTKEDCGWSAVVEAEVDEVLETTDEFCAARRTVKSRVSRFT